MESNITLIAKHLAKREQTHPMCLHTMEKYDKVESLNIKNDYETTRKK